MKTEPSSTPNALSEELVSGDKITNPGSPWEIRHNALCDAWLSTNAPLGTRAEAERWINTIRREPGEVVDKDAQLAKRLDEVALALQYHGSGLFGVETIGPIRSAEAVLRASSQAGKGDGWQPIESAPREGLIDLCAGERIYSQCYYDHICDEYRRLDHWNRLEMIKLRNGVTHWRPSRLPPRPTQEPGR